jgi:hypothetical protein
MIFRHFDIDKLALAAVVSALPAAALADIAAAPERFFDGSTQGSGTLKVVMRKASVITDRGVGRTERDGTVVLDQIVEERGKPPRKRQWRLRQVAPGRIEGTLSDARGPVIGTFARNVLDLKYTMKDGVGVTQQLRLSPDGQRAENVMTFRKFGMTVATLTGFIQRGAR